MIANDERLITATFRIFAILPNPNRRQRDPQNKTFNKMVKKLIQTLSLDVSQIC
jgi:hypothetical protein